MKNTSPKSEKVIIEIINPSNKSQYVALLKGFFGNDVSEFPKNGLSGIVIPTEKPSLFNRRVYLKAHGKYTWNAFQNFIKSKPVNIRQITIQGTETGFMNTCLEFLRYNSWERKHSDYVPLNSMMAENTAISNTVCLDIYWELLFDGNTFFFIPIPAKENLIITLLFDPAGLCKQTEPTKEAVKAEVNLKSEALTEVVEMEREAV